MTDVSMDQNATLHGPAGLMHWITLTDGVGLALWVILLLMSAISWSVMLSKGWRLWRAHQWGQQFLDFFWNASSLQDVQRTINDGVPSEPFSRITTWTLQAQRHHHRHAPQRLADAGSKEDFLTRTIKKVLDEETTQLDHGLTTLATIGSTAPFVGLFGTVWGVYHALIAMGSQGSPSLSAIAGPVGEALVMTGLGLAVAIPAVVGYNALTRHHRVLLGRLDAFAFELHTLLSTGHSLSQTTSSEMSPTPTLATV